MCKGDKTQTILVTSDIHFEKLNLAKTDSYIKYVVESIEQVKPAMFIIAGDTTDSRHLQVGSFEYLQLQRFLIALEEACKKQGTSFIILKGTPAHDGDVMKNMTKSILTHTIYIEDICVKKIKNTDILFMPQTYYISLEKFEKTVRDIVGDQKPTFAVFHGMFDFALPMVYQQNSQFSLARDVCMRAEFIESLVTHFAIGGHVHEFIKHGNVIYDGCFCNREGMVAGKNNDYGLKKVIIREHDYNIHPIFQPHLEDVNQVEYVIDDDSHIGEIIENAAKFNTTNTVFVLVTDMSMKANQEVMMFKNVIKPIYLRRKVRSDISNDTKKYLTSLQGIDDESQRDSAELLISMYEKKYKSKIPAKILTRIAGTT